MIYDGENPPLSVAIDICQKTFARHPRRVAFAGRAGAGKNTVAELIAGDRWPVFNHADKLKEEVLEWVVRSCLEGFDIDSDESFLHFANFIGLSPARIQDDLWDLVGPVYTAMIRLYITAQREHFNIVPFATMATGESLPEKIKFVDGHKEHFREALQLYGTMSKELAADPYHWVTMTIARAIHHPTCFNADTRYIDEIECLKMCGWTVIYLDINDTTQNERRPTMNAKEKLHASEWDICNSMCDAAVNANGGLSNVLMQIAQSITPAVKREVAA
jgi:hypothetical protein